MSQFGATCLVFVQIWAWYLSSGISSTLCNWCCWWYIVDACFIIDIDVPGLQCSAFQSNIIRTVSGNVVTTISVHFTHYICIFICCFSLYLQVLASGCLSHHSKLSFLNQNPPLDSICGEMSQKEEIGTLPHPWQYWKWIHMNGWLGLKQCRVMFNSYDHIWQCGLTQLDWTREVSECPSGIEHSEQLGVNFVVWW